MAIIKCPECGHQISDKAHVCPSCGVEIINNIVRCARCGDIYFKDQAECPHCHHRPMANAELSFTPTQQQNTPFTSTETTNVQTGEQTTTSTNHTSTPPANPIPPVDSNKKKLSILIVSLVVALLAGAVWFYFYTNAGSDREREAYEYALNCNDSVVLQSYLDNYKDAAPERRAKITDLLNKLKQADMEWTNAVVSGSKTALELYIQQYPNSIHKAEAIHKIDSIDWALASSTNTLEAYKSYIGKHPNGEHIDEANTNMNTEKAKTITTKEKEMIGLVFRNFFQSINARDEEGLLSSVSDYMTTFLSKTGAGKSDVIAFLNKLYKDNITSMHWRTNNDFKITKREIGTDEYEYSVDFSALQKVEYDDGTSDKETKYRIKAKVSPDEKITELNMVKVIE